MPGSNYSSNWFLTGAFELQKWTEILGRLRYVGQPTYKNNLDGVT